MYTYLYTRCVMAAGVLKTVMTVTSRVAGGWQDWQRFDDGKHWKCRAGNGVTVQVWPRTGTVTLAGSQSGCAALQAALSAAGVFNRPPAKKRKKKPKRSVPVPHVGDRVDERRAMYQSLPRGVPVPCHSGLGAFPGGWSEDQLCEPW